MFTASDIHSLVEDEMDNSDKTASRQQSMPTLPEVNIASNGQFVDRPTSRHAPPDTAAQPLPLAADPLDPPVFLANPPRSRSAVKRAISTPRPPRLNLFILRHASAGTRRANPKLDVKRPLDKEGKQHCFHLAHVLNALKLSFDLIVSSPLKRCLQTAQLVGTETGYEAKILHADALKPEADYAHFQRLIYECRSYENVLMVGHNPTLTYFLGLLIGQVATDTDSAAMARVRLRKGSMARVTLERGPALLQWMLEPRIVRALYTTSTKSSRRKTSRK